MSASVDQSMALVDQPSKASNGALNQVEYDYMQGHAEVITDGGEYTLPAGCNMINTPYVPNYYAPYVAYPAAVPTNADLAWSAVDPSAYYTGYLSPTEPVYDYTAQPATSYGWIPNFGDYSGWGVGMNGDGSALYAPEGYYTAVESYADGSSGDAQISSLEQSVKMMGLSENGYCDGLESSQLGDMSAQPKSWPVIAGQASSNAYKAKRVTVGLNGAFIDSSNWATGALRFQQMPATMDRPVPYRSGVSSKKSQSDPTLEAANILVEKLHAEHQYNPRDFNLDPENPRFFVIKSYSEDDIHRSIKYGIWCSTDYGNKRLDTAYAELNGKGPLYLFYSVNGSGHFCGLAEMCSAVDYHSSARVWAQDKWKGQFKVRWIYIKDVPNSQLRHIRLENNEGKPVTNSRDTQEVPPDKGKLVLSIIHSYRHSTSIFDDFMHYEKRQEECDQGLSAGGAEDPQFL